MVWTPRSDTGGGKWASYFRVIARRSTKATAQQQASRPGATLSSVLGELTVFGSGVELPSPFTIGRLDRPLGDLLLVASGAQTHLGTAAIDLGALTMVGSGTLRVLGSSSVTLGAVTASAAGALKINGTLSQTFGALTVSASTPAAISAPVIAFDTSQGWVTGDNPPDIQWTLPSDGTVQVGDILVRQYSTSSSFTSPTTEYHTIVSDDILDSDAAFPYATPLAGGLTYFRGAIGRGGTGVLGGFTQVSAWSSTISDTLTAAAAPDIVMSTTVPNFTSGSASSGTKVIDFQAGYAVILCLVSAAGTGDVGNEATIDGVAMTQLAKTPDGQGRIWVSASPVTSGNHNIVVNSLGAGLIKICPVTLKNVANLNMTASCTKNQVSSAAPWQPSSGNFSTIVSGQDVGVIMGYGDFAAASGIAATGGGTILSNTEGNFVVAEYAAAATPGFTGTGTKFFGCIGAQFHFS